MSKDTIDSSSFDKKLKASNQVEAVQVTNRLGQKVNILRSPSNVVGADCYHPEYTDEQLRQLKISPHPFEE